MTDRIKKNIIPIVASVVVAGVVFFALEHFRSGLGGQKQPEAQEDDLSCLILPEKKIIRGDSMSPSFQSGEEVVALMDFYECNKHQRGEAVLVSYPGNENLLFKFIRGLPGDEYFFQEIRLENQGIFWQLSLNGEVLKNSSGESYVFSEETKKEIQKYQDVYGNKIPEGRFLVLGDDPEGSIDSTQFGLASETSIFAKVIRDEKGIFE